MATMELFEVVGGAHQGGIVVRSGCEPASTFGETKLSTGAVVKALECRDGKLHYELVEGTGPSTGWVTMKLLGKDQVVKQGSGIYGGSLESMDPKGYPEVSAKEMEALRQYEEKFGEARDGTQPAGFNRKSFPWFSKPAVKETSPELLKAAQAFKETAAVKPCNSSRKPRFWDVDSDGEEVHLCSWCQLPLGEHVYNNSNVGALQVHTECMAHVMIEEMQESEAKLQSEQREKKLKNRSEYEIGWCMGSVPKNSTLAEKMGCLSSPKGLCCIVYNELDRSVSVAATLEPAASVNLEYLLLALKVRRQEQREPLFSLDPVDPSNMQKTLQVKRYEPAWLAGTSVGDVMFQADYFLKELALGEYTQPIAGMKSVFDWSELMDRHDKEWAGREWFVVNKAEVRLAEDKTIVPCIKMGVEAREQALHSDGTMHDLPVTAPNHPLKKFAESFTRNFDLIAERKSVVFHLRELAKASVIAKFLVDSGAKIDKSWYNLADQIIANTPAEKFPEIPQLWNMRGLSRIQVKDGKLLDAETGLQSNLHAIYGGVQFGLDRFELAQRSSLYPAGAQPGAAMQQPGLQGMQVGPSGRPMFMPQRFQLTQRGETPQGVDLNLDKFQLSEPERFAGMLPACSAGKGSLEASVTLGQAFLKSFRERSYQVLKDEHKSLLQSIFNSSLADRLQEGDSFIPPDPNAAYVLKLKNLIDEEQGKLLRRKSLFFDRSFAIGHAGPEFPSSWTAQFQVARPSHSVASQEALRTSLVQLEVDDTFQQSLMEDILPKVAPEFKKTTEDGTLFRIYRLGSLEVRTVQEPHLAEKVGVVFLSKAPTWSLHPAKSASAGHDEEKIVKANLYLEGGKYLDQNPSGKRLSQCHHYVVLQTDHSNVMVMEMLADGSTTTDVNPQSVEVRNSLSKLLQTVDDCEQMNVTYGDLKVIASNHSMPHGKGDVRPSTRKRYAKALMSKLCNATKSK
eukprot:TRINITY_DN4638_c0_g4_i1.p1 TRINITY_DN4638_c0_g4~~TRINITY_DN4638_c0_g4_i1.p1  ORF type:complete len:962 (-),score=205.08 TRINITY_DN4638_c0_g4_i1:117-3002(-)